MFGMIGADARISRLPSDLERDPRGYLCTGRDLTTWKLDCHPFPFETTLPGVYCAADVRHKSIKLASNLNSGMIQQYRRGRPADCTGNGCNL